MRTGEGKAKVYKGLQDISIQPYATLYVETAHADFCDRKRSIYVNRDNEIAHFHSDRPDLVQVVTKTVVKFCAHASDETLPIVQRRDMMLQTTKDIQATLKIGMEGSGHFRLSSVFEELWLDNELKAAYINNPISVLSMPFQ